MTDDRPAAAMVTGLSLTDLLEAVRATCVEARERGHACEVTARIVFGPSGQLLDWDVRPPSKRPIQRAEKALDASRGRGA